MTYRNTDDMAKKVLLVKLEDHHQVYPPYGLMYLASALKANGYEFEIFHETINKKNIERLIKKSKTALAVGFSVMTIPSLYHILKTSREIKRRYKTPIIWGGCHPSMLPDITLKDEGVDYVIIKEGEESLLELLKCIGEGKEPKDVNGVGYKTKKGKIVVNKSIGVIKDLDKYHYSFVWDKLDVKKYLSPRFGKYKKVLPIITTRGCPHNCNFCYNSFMHERKWRRHDIEFVTESINKLKEKYKIDGIFYVDDNMFTIKDRGFEIVERIGLPWIASIRADYITEEFMEKAKKTRCGGLWIGAESGSDRVLKEVINKGITTEDIKKALTLCDKYEINAELSFIIGMPYETKREMKQTLDFMLFLYKNYKKVSFWGPKVFTPYPGTEMYDKALELGLKEPVSSLDWATKFYRYSRCNLPWIKNKKIDLLYLVVGLAQMKDSLITKPMKLLEEWRWRNFNLKFPVELELVRVLSKNKSLLSLFFRYFKK